MSLEVTALTNYITVVTNQDDTVTVTTQNPSPSQTAILFEDEGAALGTRGTVNEISFVGSGVTATRSGDKITVSVTSGGGGGTWGSITGTLSSQTDLQNELDKKILYLSATGTNTYTAAYSLAAYTTGQTFAVIFANANTGAATLNVNSLGAKSIVKRGSTALIGNDIIANESYILFYDGTNFQLIGRAAPFSDANPIVKNAADYTKQAILSAASITTGITRTYTLPDKNGTVAMTSDAWLLASGGTLTADNTIDGSFILNLNTKSIQQTQPAQSSGWGKAILSTPGAHTALTATTEFISRDFAGATQTWLDGTVATQRFNYFRGFTVNKTTTSATFTDIFNGYFDLSTAGTGVTFTRNWALGLGGSMLIDNTASGIGVFLKNTTQYLGFQRMPTTGNLGLGSFGGGGSGWGVDFVDNGGAAIYARFLGNASASSASFAFGSTTTTNAQFYIVQGALSSSWKPAFRLDPGAHTSLTTATEFIANDFQGANWTWAAGTIAIQRFNYFRAFTVTTGLASDAYTVWMDPPTGNITRPWALGLNGNLDVRGSVKFNGTNSTGAGSAALGANSPATTLTAPYTWITAISADGSTVYIPCWK